MIAGMLRVKNEARWIDRCLSSIADIVDHIFILDDHSTDGTAEICKRFQKAIVFESPFDGFDEARDKNYLLSKVSELRPDWVIALDGDEILRPESIDPLRRAIQQNNKSAFGVRILYLWDEENQVRIDGIYSRFQGLRVFRFIPGSSFENRRIHCGSVPQSNRSNYVFLPSVAFLHLGYLHRSDRIRKYAFYNAIDPDNSFEDYYRHMVIGDMFPVDAHFKWAGPLVLSTLQILFEPETAKK